MAMFCLDRKSLIKYACRGILEWLIYCCKAESQNSEYVNQILLDLLVNLSNDVCLTEIGMMIICFYVLDV